jgi:hypothetical protein
MISIVIVLLAILGFSIVIGMYGEQLGKGMETYWTGLLKPWYDFINWLSGVWSMLSQLKPREQFSPTPTPTPPAPLVPSIPKIISNVTKPSATVVSTPSIASTVTATSAPVSSLMKKVTPLYLGKYGPMSASTPKPVAVILRSRFTMWGE